MHRLRALLLASACAIAVPALADPPKVALAGSMGQRALLVINGGAPRAVAVGSSVEGVKVLSVSPTAAVVEVEGERQTLVLGASQLDLGGKGARGGSGGRIVLSAGSGGHFSTLGTINGQSVRFMVDTGATLIALDEAHARRLRLRLPPAPNAMMHTANGAVPGYRLKLDSVRIGDVEVYNVEAVVTQQAMPMVLLGNSFLSRFQLRRDNDQLTLERRF